MLQVRAKEIYCTERKLFSPDGKEKADWKFDPSKGLKPFEGFLRNAAQFCS